MLVEDLCGGSPAEDFAWPVVEGVSDSFKVVRAPSGQVSALGEVLAQHAVGVLVRRALPRRVRVGEEHARAGLQRELGVPGQFLTPIPRDRLTHLLRKRRDRRAQRLVHRLRAVAAQRRAVLYLRLLTPAFKSRKMYEDRGAATTLDERADRGAAGTDDEVAFPNGLARHGLALRRAAG